MPAARRIWLTLAALAAVLIGAFFWLGANVERFLNRVVPAPLPRVSEAARSLHAASFVVDLHADTLLFGRDLLARSEIGQVDLPRLREGGVGLQLFTAPTKTPWPIARDGTSADGFDVLTLAGVARLDRFAFASPLARARLLAERLADAVVRADGGLRLVRSRADLEALLAARRSDPSVVGALYGLEGAHALEGDPQQLETVFEFGVRMIGLAHFFDNAFVGSSYGVEKHGLTPRGRALVRAMEARGVVVDLAHVSPRGVADVLALATKPVLVSHTGVRGTCDNQRNLSDEQVRAVAANGGVIGIGYFELAVCGTKIEHVVAAIRHVVDLVGDTHVALGSDYDGSITAGFDTSRLPALTQALLDDGHSPEAVQRILGGNALRVLRQTLPSASRSAGLTSRGSS